MVCQEAWKKSYDKPRQNIKKGRHHFANKGLYSQSYGFSSSHVQICELDYKEGWVPKNWYFQTVVLEKTLESPLDCKEIKPINPRGRSQDGRGLGWGDHFLPHKFIRRPFECWANTTKQLLNTGRGHQPSRKAAHSLRKEVEQNIKDKKRGKRSRDGEPSWGGSCEAGEVSTQ